MKKIAVLVTFVLAFVLGACVPLPAAAPAFAAGKYRLEGSETRALQFNEDGSFAALDGSTELAHGTYSVKGDIYTETSNDQGCPSPRDYKYTFDGAKLVFHPIEDPATDPCDGRRADFIDTVSWILTQ